MGQVDLPLLSIVVAIGSLIVSIASMIVSYLAYRRYRPAVNISADNLPPYHDEEKTSFTFENVGSGDLVSPVSIVRVSWEPLAEIHLDWGETTVLSPTSKKVMQCRLPDPPTGLYTIEVAVFAEGVVLPKKTFTVRGKGGT